jgi:hypothetical protein
VASRPIEDRKSDVDRHRQQTDAADSLADRKSLEAERVAALDLARSAVLRELAEEIEQLHAEMAPRLWALEQAEAQLAVEIGGSASISERVSAASKAIKIHDDAYSDFRQDDKAMRDVTLRRQSTKASLDALQSADVDWRSAWAPAVSALGRAESIEPERANEIATQRATAGGLLDGLRLTRARLLRMDDDEKELREKVETVAGTLDFVLPDDGLAAGVMLGERLDAAPKIASEREVLAVQLKEQMAEQDRKQQSWEAALANTAGLCGEARCEPADLEALALRSRQCSAAEVHRLALAETVRRNRPPIRRQSSGRHFA